MRRLFYLTPQFVAILLILLFSASLSASAKGLLDERIWKIPGKKRSIFVEEGIFHKKADGERETILMAMRHSFDKKNKIERIVFDFDIDKIPTIYGRIVKDKKIIYIDFFKTKIHSNINSFGNTYFIKEINFFPVSEDRLSLELTLKDYTSVDIFDLQNKGRLVLDLKK